MPERIPVRLLAPAALVAFAIALVVTVAVSVQGSSERSAAPSSAVNAHPAHPRRPPRTYVVKSGDALSKIADRTGVPVARLEALNPSLDPQTLAPGRRLKLRP